MSEPARTNGLSAGPACRFGFLGMLLLSATTVWADQVRLREFWIPNVTVQGVVSGHLIYLSPSGSEVNQSLGKVQAVKLDAFPKLGEAEDAIIGKKLRKALGLLEAVQGLVRQPWLRQWVTARRVWVAEQLGKATVAVDAYVELIKMNADAHYLERAPVDSVARANDVEKKQIADRLKALTQGMQDAVSKQIAQLISKTKVDAPMSGASHDNETVVLVRPGAVPQDSKVVLSRAINNGDPITQMLRRGEFEQALQAAKRDLTVGRNISVRLYQQGIAQLYLAETTGDPTLYKDAGLSFMRIVVHFPRSAYAGAAMMEVGLVHQRIGRPDLAASLYERAGLAVDPEVEPELVGRLATLRKRLTVTN